MIDVAEINFSKLNGLVPAVIIDRKYDKILMLGFMNEAALKQTIETEKATFFSRSRNTLWTKGQTSGNYLVVEEILSDCDNDSLLIFVNPLGPACHIGNYSCFPVEPGIINFLEKLTEIIEKRKQEMPENSYTARLFKEGSDRIIQKVGEEAVEVVIAAKSKEKQKIINESADLLFHLMVMLADNDIELNEIVDELKSRR